jgi:thiamine phosphate synthase YjbQ (UPF0047 family)
MPLSFNILYKHGMMETDIRMFVPLRLLPALTILFEDNKLLQGKWLQIVLLEMETRK